MRPSINTKISRLYILRFRAWVLYLFFGLLSWPAATQNRWEFAASGVFLNYFGDFTPNNVVSSETHVGWGSSLRYALSSSWGLRVNFFSGKISGHYHNFPAGTDQRKLGFAFSNRLHSCVSALDWEPLYYQRKGKKKFQPGLSPFLSVGYGLVFHHPTVHFKTENNLLSEELRNNIALDLTYSSTSTFILHFSAGTKLYFSKNAALAFEVVAQPAISDYLDGVSLSANPGNNDGIVAAFLSLTYILHPKKKDSDGDGVPDTQDDCPHQKGKKSLGGCPSADPDKNTDRDGDGVPNGIDRCPDLPGNPLYRGCPKKINHN